MDPRRVVERGYDKIGEKYVDWSSGGESRAREQHTRRLTQSLSHGAEVLDLGCGAGIPTALELAKNFQITGVDISARQVELARCNVPEASFIHGDMSSAEFSTQRFDAVTSFYSITHLPRRLHGPLLERIFGWLRPGGAFIASLGVSETEGIEGDWLGAPMYFSHYDAQTNRALIESAGFEIESAEEITDSEECGPVIFLWVVAHKPL
jgi:ubiquinone/menaquinone biosynthesis C-methylase UbiE